MCEKMCHNLKAQTFYSFLREKQDDILTISFDWKKDTRFCLLYMIKAPIILGRTFFPSTRLCIYTHRQRNKENRGNNLSTGINQYVCHVRKCYYACRRRL
ncbi:hypothetical protein PR048_008831 [Dryococelus australis]|uniref:Uncharacterized protein n=1 Tax=Dryococelus australis TaxID=614101 RepID=A0ABQ9HY75_9NEOP|nr:hypothetical protein PR048_008831 [Dryococelus australis]